MVSALHFSDLEAHVYMQDWLRLEGNAHLSPLDKYHLTLAIVYLSLLKIAS